VAGVIGSLPILWLVRGYIDAGGSLLRDVISSPVFQEIKIAGALRWN
jgi:hypothetical protein